MAVQSGECLTRHMYTQSSVRKLRSRISSRSKMKQVVKWDMWIVKVMTKVMTKAMTKAMVTRTEGTISGKTHARTYSQLKKPDGGHGLQIALRRRLRKRRDRRWREYIPQG